MRIRCGFFIRYPFTHHAPDSPEDRSLPGALRSAGSLLGRDGLSEPSGA
ncbi:MAG: hypothetical protein WED15_04695 [Akkermansiaceae bacterium]